MLAEELAGRVGFDSRGMEFTPAGEDLTRVRIYLRLAETADQAAAEIRGLLDSEGHASEVRVEPVADDDWVERFQRTLKPIAIGRRFLIVPGDEQADPGERTALHLIPGRAFGTGEHPTTQLCIEQLEERVESGSRWLDIGAGTAVLSMAARHLGAGEVVGIDNDPVAVEVAAEVLKRNGVQGVRLITGSIETVDGGFDGVVANINRPFFTANERVLGGLVRPGGLFIASGFLGDDVEELTGVFEASGLRVDSVHRRDPWVALVAHRPD